MRFAFTDDQTLFAEGLRDLLAKECRPARVRAAWDDGAGHDATLWDHLAEMGVFGMLVPEAAGGLGGTEVDLVLLLEELGRAAAPGPVLETAAVVAPALGDAAVVGTAALDGSPYVPHAQVASVVLVPGGVLRLEDATLSPVDGIDGGRRLFAVEDAEVEPLDYDEELAFDRGALAAAAYLVGLGERMIDVAAEYARQREQYGRPIGVNQAVKHLLADALLKVEFAKPAVYRAAWSVAEREPTRSRDVSMAKAFASDAAYRSSRSAMQVHGAIGYTWEADLQLWMKKAWALQRAWGDATFHRRRVADAVLTVGP
jgi:alkylation response protein AidB-like acyl-CoA dehydrogenase